MIKERLSFSDEARSENGKKLSKIVTMLKSTSFDFVLMGLVIAGMILAVAEVVFAQSSSPIIVNNVALQNATCALFAYLEGSFGALIMVASGVGAIISSAFGQYRASLGMMVVAIGSFVLKSLAITFFGVESVTGGKCQSD